MAKWAEPRIEDLLSALHRIERVAELIMNDKTAGNYWNVQRAGEIKLLAQVVERMVREPMNNGDA
jgi:HAMP domain-containing protein